MHNPCMNRWPGPDAGYIAHLINHNIFNPWSHSVTSAIPESPVLGAQGQADETRGLWEGALLGEGGLGA